MSDKFVNAVVIYNPLDPEDRSEGQIEWRKGLTLKQCLEGAPEEVEWIVSLNDDTIAPEKFAKTKVSPNDFIIMAPAIHGGGGGGKKSIFKLVAMIALAVVAPQVAGALGAAFGTAGNLTLLGKIASAAISTIGGLLLEAIFPAAKPKPIVQPDIQNEVDSPSFGIDGPKNISQENIPVPIVYGTFRIGGNRTQINTVNQGNTQLVRMQTLLSEGPIQSVSEVEIDNQPEANFEDVTTITRLGVDDQQIVGWFNDTSVFFSKQAKLTENFIEYETEDEIDKFRVDLVAQNGMVAIDSTTGARHTINVSIVVEYKKTSDVTWTQLGDNDQFEPITIPDFGDPPPPQAERIYTTHDSATQFDVQIVSPATVPITTTEFEEDSENTGLLTPVQVTRFQWAAEAFYRAVGDEEWILLGTRTGLKPVRNQTQRTQFGSGILPQGAYEIKITKGRFENIFQFINVTRTMSGRQRSAVRMSIDSPVLESDRYDIRVRRTTPNTESDFRTEEITWSDVVEIQTEDVLYNHSAMLNTEVRLSDQLNSIPTITALVEGRVLNIYDRFGNIGSAEFTANPAYVSLDILLNKRYGAAVDPSRIDFVRWAEWADFCTEKGFEFNGVFDFSTNIWEALRVVMRAGHAQLAPVGTKYSVVIEKPDIPKMLFGVSNIVKDSLALEWLPKEDRANEVEVTFYDKDNSFKERTVRTTDFEALARGEKRKSVNVTILGITDIERANFEGHFQLALNRHIHLTATFDAPTEAVSVKVGDLIYVQHDMPLWGLNGRLKAGSTTNRLELDRPVEILPDRTYTVLLHHSAIKRWDATVEVIGVNSVFVSGVGDATQNLTRMTVNGEDVEVIEVVDGTPNVEIVLREMPTMALGNVVELWDTDVIEERSVTNPAGSGITQLDVGSGFTQAPAQFVNWMFGEINKVKKPFRVRAIADNDDEIRSIACVEYIEDIYTDPENVEVPPNFSDIPLVIDHVTIDRVDEEIIKNGSNVFTRATIYWDLPAEGDYQGADIFLAINSQTFETVGRVRSGATSFQMPVQDDDVLFIKVLPFDGAGKHPTTGLAGATEYIHTVAGLGAAPSQVQGFTVSKVVGGIEAKWTANPEGDVIGYEIRQGSSFNDGALVVTNFAGNRILFDKVSAGVNTYHIKAIDSLRNYSEEVTSASLSVSGPSDVTGFEAFNNQGFVIFRWNQNSEPDIRGYELRHGPNWDAAEFIDEVQGTSHTIPAPAPDAVNYWIKAVDRTGIFSTNAVLATTNVPELPNRNVVITENEKTDSFDGFKHYCTLSGGNLLADAGAAFSEYSFAIDPASSITARVTLEDTLDAVQNSLTTWAAATFSWNDAQANVPWERTGNIESVSLERQIAIKNDAPNSIEAFPLNDTLVGTQSTSPTGTANIAYAPARFRNGLTLGDTVAASWAVTFGSEFYMTGWFRPDSVPAQTERILYIEGPSDTFLSLEYNTDTSFSLRASDTNTLTTAGITLAADDLLFFAIVQTATIRKLMIGRMSDQTILIAQAAFAPVGSMTSWSVGLGNDPLDWNDMTFPWNDAQANIGWDAAFGSSGIPVMDGQLSDIDIVAGDISSADFLNKMLCASPSDHSRFVPFVPSDYTFDLAMIRYILRTTTADQPRITKLIATADMPDIIDRGSNTLAAAQTTINFNKSYLVAPEVTAVQKGGSSVAIPRVVSISTTSFDVILENTSGTAVAGDVSWTAVGY